MGGGCEGGAGRMTQGSPSGRGGGDKGGEGGGLRVSPDQEIRAHRQLGPPTDCTELVRSAGAALLAPAADKKAASRARRLFRVLREICVTPFLGYAKNCPSKFCTNSARMAPGRPKMGPRWARYGPRWLQGGFQIAQDGSRWPAKDSPTVALETAKVGGFQKTSVSHEGNSSFKNVD